MTKKIGPATTVPPGTVIGVDDSAIGNRDGEYFGTSRRCRHLGGDLGNGSISVEGCLVCPWHGAQYDVTNGRMVKGPQGIFAKVPGLGTFFKGVTKVVPLSIRKVYERDGELYED